MASSVGKIEINALTGGLNTDSTELTTPPNTTTSEDNFDITRKGTRKRRRGFALETGEYSAGTLEDSGVANFRWDAVAKDGNRNFEVIQYGDTLHFYDASISPLHEGKKDFTVDLNNFIAPLVNRADFTLVDMDSGKGVLWVTGISIKPFYIEYDEDTDTISTTAIDMKIRDLTQLDTTDPTREGSSLTAQRRYDLLNQGWYETDLIIGTASETLSVTINEGEDVSVASYPGAILDGYFEKFGRYPPKTKPWWVGKGAVTVNVHEKVKGVFNDNDFTKDFVSFSKESFDLYFGGNTLAPLGHYIVDPFYKDRTAASGVKNLETETIKKRPTAIAFYSGRVFYALDNTLYFSQVILDDLGASARCYQEADPSAEDTIGLVASDGGVITIPEMGNVLRLMSVEGSLIIFADNGVWFLFTPSGQGFRADSFQVDFITSRGIAGAHTLVDVNGRPYWWSEIGIHTLIPLEGRIGYQEVDITSSINREDGRGINTYYNETIPVVSKRFAKGEYDSAEKVIRWIWGSDVETITTETVPSYSFDSGFTATTTPDDLDSGATFLNATSGNSPNSQFLTGEDGNTYLVVAEDSNTSAIRFVDVTSGPTPTVSKTRTEVFTDLDANVDLPSPATTWSNLSAGRFLFAPVPNTSYFWIIMAIQPNLSLPSYIYAGCMLYQLNSSSGIDLIGGFAERISVSGDDYIGEIVGIGTLGDNRITSDLLLAINPSSSGDSSYLIRLPSVAEQEGSFVTKDTTGIFQGTRVIDLKSDVGDNFFNTLSTYKNKSSYQKVAFLPTDDDKCKMIAYFSYSETQWHIDNPSPHTNGVDFVYNQVDTYPNGFMAVCDLQKKALETVGFSATTVAVNNSLFKDTDGSTDLIPWSDVGLQRDGSTGDEEDAYACPSVHRDPSNNKWICMFPRIYSIATTSLYTSGSYAKLIFFEWNPSTQIATKTAEGEGPTFVPGTDVSGSLYTTTVAIQIPGLAGSQVYFAMRMSGSSSSVSTRWVVSEFGTYTAGALDTYDARFATDRMLNYHLVYDAFYPYSYNITSSPQQYIAGIVKANTTASEAREVNVCTIAGDDVVDRIDENVIIDQQYEVNTRRDIKYIAITQNDNIRFGEFNSETFLDWGTDSYVPTLTTFYHIPEDSMTYLQSPWVYTYLTRTGTDYQAAEGDGTI